MDVGTILGSTLVALIVIAPVIVFIRRRPERQRQFQAYASAHGFSYAAKERLPVDLRDNHYFRDIGQWNLGRSVTYTMRRKEGGIEALIFDYWYIRQMGLTSASIRAIRATVICLRNMESGPWHVTHEDHFQYLDLDLLCHFIDESVRKLAVKSANALVCNAEICLTTDCGLF